MTNNDHMTLMLATELHLCLNLPSDRFTLFRFCNWKDFVVNSNTFLTTTCRNSTSKRICHFSLISAESLSFCDTRSLISDCSRRRVRNKVGHALAMHTKRSLGDHPILCTCFTQCWMFSVLWQANQRQERNIHLRLDPDLISNNVLRECNSTKKPGHFQYVWQQWERYKAQRNGTWVRIAQSEKWQSRNPGVSHVAGATLRSVTHSSFIQSPGVKAVRG